jgi:hypothetical protein
MRFQPLRPSHETLTGDSADVCFAHAPRILEREGLDPGRIPGITASPRLARIDLAAWWSAA